MIHGIRVYFEWLKKYSEVNLELLEFIGNSRDNVEESFPFGSVLGWIF